jgi:hypothetical protein
MAGPKRKRLLQQAHEGRRDPHGFLGGPGIDVRDLARVAVEAELTFETFNLRQGLFARRPQMGGIRAMQHELEARRHGVRGKDDRSRGQSKNRFRGLHARNLCEGG